VARKIKMLLKPFLHSFWKSSERRSYRFNAKDTFQTWKSSQTDFPCLCHWMLGTLQKYQIPHHASEKIKSTRNMLCLNQMAKLNELWLKMRSHAMLNFDILGEVL